MGKYSKIEYHPSELERARTALAYGFLNLGMFIQGKYQQSFLAHPPSTPGGPPAVRTGNLRRSAHTVAYKDGQIIETAGATPADYSGEIEGEFGVIVGTNTGYGLFVELGTVHAAARPALVPAQAAGMAQATRLIGQGAKRYYGRSAVGTGDGGG
jgi:hypothetical protein